MTFSSPLTRSAMRKLAPETQPLEPQKLKLSGAAAATVSDDAIAGTQSTTAATGVHKRTGTDRELLIQEYATYQHGLAATKRRRALPMSPTSSSQGASEATAVLASAAEPVRSAPIECVEPSAEPATTATSTATADGDATCSAEPAAAPTATLEIAVSAPAAAPAMAVAVATLSSEEKRMDGAPEGELFLVTVLARAEIEASADAAAEAQALTELLEAKAQSNDSAADNAVSWGREYAALDSVRRFAIHHPEQLQQLVARALPLLVCPAVSSLRSAMTRNALLCIQDVILCLRDDVADSLDAMLPLLLNRAASEKQFIRDLAREVLDSAVETCANEALLLTLLRMSGAEKNPQAVNVIGVYVHKCIVRMDRALLVTVVLERHASFVDEMRALLSCKVVECKAATRKGLQYTRRIVGEPKFVELVKRKLSGSAQFDVLRASELKTAVAKPTAAAGAKLSMRERMLQMRKQQAASRATSSDAFDVVVVAAPPPHSRSVSS